MNLYLHCERGIFARIILPEQCKSNVFAFSYEIIKYSQLKKLVIPSCSACCRVPRYLLLYICNVKLTKMWQTKWSEIFPWLFGANSCFKSLVFSIMSYWTSLFLYKIMFMGSYQHEDRTYSSTPFFKRNATFLNPFFPVTLGHLPWTLVMYILSNGSESNLRKTLLRYS